MLYVLSAVPQQHVHKENDVVAQQQLCSQERISSLDQEELEPSQIKEEEEELCTSQEEEQFVMKLELDTFMLTPTYEETDQQPLFSDSHADESRDEKEGKHGDFRSSRDAEPDTNRSKCHSDDVHNPFSEIHRNTQTGKNHSGSQLD